MSSPVKFLFLFFLFFSSLTAQEQQKKSTICLSMIVKDEAHVIIRCLETVRPIIDSWAIVDTGSTDGTQEIIKEYLKDIPGELQEHPWVDFAYNRNQALELAKSKADYSLIIDADEMLEYKPDFSLPQLDKDSYLMTLRRGACEYCLTSLCKNSVNWQWNGVLHEYLYASEAKSQGHIPNVVKTTKNDGNRSKDPKKYEKDAQVLENALEKEPNNLRYTFYLAQSYRDARMLEKSLETYEKYVCAKGTWDQEVFYSLWQMARLQQRLDRPKEVVTKAYLRAFAYRPTRAEPLRDLSRYYRDLKDFEKSYKIAKIGMQIPKPTDVLFVDATVYEYDMALECAVSAYWTGRYQESQEISTAMLASPTLPPHLKPLVTANLGFANAKLAEEVIAEEVNP